MSLYVLSDAPIGDVVNLLLQESYTENTIAYNDNPEAYDVRSVDGVLISMDYGGSAYGPVLGILFNRWKNLSTRTGRQSEKTCYLAWSSLLTETSHVWGH